MDGVKESWARDRLVGRGSWDDEKMEWMRDCYVSFVVCGGPVAEPRKKRG
jgi:hypothetical protein